MDYEMNPPESLAKLKENIRQLAQHASSSTGCTARYLMRKYCRDICVTLILSGSLNPEDKCRFEISRLQALIEFDVNKRPSRYSFNIADVIKQDFEQVFTTFISSYRDALTAVLGLSTVNGQNQCAEKQRDIIDGSHQIAGCVEEIGANSFSKMENADLITENVAKMSQDCQQQVCGTQKVGIGGSGDARFPAENQVSDTPPPTPATWPTGAGLPLSEVVDCNATTSNEESHYSEDNSDTHDRDTFLNVKNVLDVQYSDNVCNGFLRWQRGVGTAYEVTSNRPPGVAPSLYPLSLGHVGVPNVYVSDNKDCAEKLYVNAVDITRVGLANYGVACDKVRQQCLVVQDLVGVSGYFMGTNVIAVGSTPSNHHHHPSQMLPPHTPDQEQPKVAIQSLKIVDAIIEINVDLFNDVCPVNKDIGGDTACQFSKENYVTCINIPVSPAFEVQSDDQGRVRILPSPSPSPLLPDTQQQQQPELEYLATMGICQEACNGKGATAKFQRVCSDENGIAVHLNVACIDQGINDQKDLVIIRPKARPPDCGAIPTAIPCIGIVRCPANAPVTECESTIISFVDHHGNESTNLIYEDMNYASGFCYEEKSFGRLGYVHTMASVDAATKISSRNGLRMELFSQFVLPFTRMHNADARNDLHQGNIFSFCNCLQLILDLHGGIKNEMLGEFWRHKVKIKMKWMLIV